MTRASLGLAVLVVAVLLAGCGGQPTAVGPTGIDELTIPTPSPDPADFSAHATNVWFPLERGDRWTYRQYLPTGIRTLLAVVLRRPRRIAGVVTTAVSWQVRAHGRDRTALVRWYAVDRAGNVWWFGQRVPARTPGIDALAPRSWQAGRGGAEAGLVLSAAPRVGDGYLNASEPLVVARRSTVESVTAGIATRRRTFRDAVLTQDLSALVPAHVVMSYFVRGVGLVGQQDTRASSSGSGRSSSLILVRMHPGLPRLGTAG